MWECQGQKSYNARNRDVPLRLELMQYRSQARSVRKKFQIFETRHRNIVKKEKLMSLDQVSKEVSRFLISETPEILCIHGQWGIGKTFFWKNFIHEASQNSLISSRNYSYVSLFGLNSLDDLRFSIFENTVKKENIGKIPDLGTVSDFISASKNIIGHNGVPSIVASMFGLKGTADLLAKSAFFLVKRQLVCLDDLERAGSGLGVREVLGLASYLKEERGCKVVLLLNDEEFDQRPEFERHLEKVADVSLRFRPSSEELTGIALGTDSRIKQFLKPRIIELGITNIRVIKKIERLTLDVFDIIGDVDPEIMTGAVASIALLSWSIHQPNLAPPLNSILAYDRAQAEANARMDKPDLELGVTYSIIGNYPFDGMDDVDFILLDGVKFGYFDRDALCEVVGKLGIQRKSSSQRSGFSRVWEDRFHGDLTVDDDVFLDEMYTSAIENISAISPTNINSAIRLLRECRRDRQADDVLDKFMIAHEGSDVSMFDVGNYAFSIDGGIDQKLHERFIKRQNVYDQELEPLDVLRSIANTGDWNRRDIDVLARQSVDVFEKMFESLRGKEIRGAIRATLSMERFNDESDREVASKAIEALRRIASKSILRSHKLNIAGFDVNKYLNLERQGRT